MGTQPGIKRILGLLLILLLVSCTGQSQPLGTYIWIDVPVDGTTFPAVQPINIEGHTSSLSGVSRIEILIDGELFTTLQNTSADKNLASFQTSWTAQEPGEYIVQVVAFGADGTASPPDSARIRVGNVATTVPVVTTVPVITTVAVISITPTLTPTATITPTAIISVTPTLVSPTPATVIQFWADPAEIEAGACTTLRWHVENAQRVIFGGAEQSFDGTYSDCMCEGKHFTLRVIKLDGAEETRSVDISVTGSCVTPVPRDTTPPPVPAPAVPADDLSLSCRATQSLVWLPVKDDSGISEYQVEVNRSADNKKWSKVTGSPFTGIDGKTKTIKVECGYYYRWRVRAVDGEGNTSSWSDWSRFSIPLT